MTTISSSFGFNDGNFYLNLSLYPLHSIRMVNVMFYFSTGDVSLCRIRFAPTTIRRSRYIRYLWVISTSAKALLKSIVYTCLYPINMCKVNTSNRECFIVYAAIVSNLQLQCICIHMMWSSVDLILIGHV